MATRTRSRPFVTANFALTWDARITTRNRSRADFSSKTDKRRLLEIRSTGDALLLGKTTIEKENLAMGLPAEDLRAKRVHRGQAPYPMRVIVTNSGRINPALKIFQKQFSPIIIYSTQRMPNTTRAALEGIAAVHLGENDVVDLAWMLQHLRKSYSVKRVICEGGAELFRSLLDRGLVDEIHITLCPRIFGGADAPTLTGVPGNFLPRSIRCKLAKMEVIGDECFLRYRVAK